MQKNSENIIRVCDISVQYGDRQILENVSFNVKRGEIFVIVGSSGSGKSTLLRQMIGLEVPGKGTVYINDEDFSHANETHRKKILSTFGVLFQSGGLFNSMTVAENIKLMLETYTDLSEERMDKLINMKLKSVNLNGFENYYPSELSGGMKKRAGLARAMALDPEILFFDEPSSGLDPVTSATLDSLIKNLNHQLGTTMIIVTHDLSSILDISDRIVMLDRDAKGIIVEGTPKELINYTANSTVYSFFNRVSEFK
jgi:phospholipid/cholesterol/gamma-HCH transport system ATP-binding protein